jgi:tetratricopeptide (TPR) repeat protein
LARLEFPNGNLEGAASELAACLRAAPDNAECRAALLDYGLNIAGAEPDSLEPLLDGWPADRRGFLYFRRLGELRFKQGRWDEAFQAFSKSIEIRPDTPGIHHQLGTVLVRLERTEEAELEFRRSAEIGVLLDYERVKRLFESIPMRVQAGNAIRSDARAFEQIAQFFESIGRQNMASRWKRAAEQL